MATDAPPTSTTPSGDRQTILIALALVAVVLLVFYRTLGFDFVDWDDDLNIIRNPYYASFHWGDIGRFWLHAYSNQYMPVTWSVWDLLASAGRLPSPQARIGGLATPFSPFPFHLLGLACHLTNVVLVFFLLRRLLGRLAGERDVDLPAAAGALLFGLHPLQVESAAWVDGGNITLAYTFGIGALLLFVRFADSRRWSLYVAATVLFALGLLSKPTVVSVLLVAAALQAFLYRRPFRDYAAPLGGWVLLAAANTAMNWSASSVSKTVHVAIALRPLIAGDALAFYLGKLFAPVGLGMNYARSPDFVMAHDFRFVTWIAPVALAIVLWRFGSRGIQAAGLVFAAALLPLIGFVPFYYQLESTVADRYIYFAMLGPALALACTLDRFAVAKKPALAAGVAAALGVLGVLSYFQAQTWRDTLTLYLHAEKVQPLSPTVNYNLGGTLQRDGHFAEAIPYYREALKLYPAYASAHTNLGLCLEKAGQPDEAAEQYRQALQIDPGQPQANFQIGMYYAGHGQRALAISYWRHVLERRPDEVRALFALGVALLESGQRAEGIQDLQKAHALRPDVAEIGARLARELQPAASPSPAVSGTPPRPAP